MIRTCVLVLALAFPVVTAEARAPIIDMHLHARRLGPITDAPPLCAPPTAMPRWDNSLRIEQGLTQPPCADPLTPARNGEQVLRDTVAIMERHNIIAMASGEPEDLDRWHSTAPSRVVRGLDLRILEQSDAGRFRPRSAAEVRALYEAGKFQVLGEVMAQYEGIPPEDLRLEPYWALAEELGIPVGIHLGPGNGGDAYAGNPLYRAAGSSALGLEPVLVKHPRLRIYIMHAGYPLIDDLLAVLAAHPQVYVDTSALVGTEPRAAFYRYLRQIVESGFGERVMFGTDQGVWPELIERSITAIEDAPFLSARQKRDILYNNAARFLRLTPKEMALHRRM